MKRTVVVCGGSKGIGAATVRLLLKEMFNVICISRSIGELEDLTDMAGFTFLACDLKDEGSLSTTIGQISEEDNIWGIVNNASGPRTGPFQDATRMDYLSALETHLFAADSIVKGLCPEMIKARQGRIVNIISVTAKVPLSNMCVSNTLRGAMLNWSKTLSKELGPSNITVNNVLPGYTETNRLSEVIKGVSSKIGITEEEYSQRILEQVPLKRFAHPMEVASVVCFLLSDNASFVNGASIPVDGGWTSCS